MNNLVIYGLKYMFLRNIESENMDLHEDIVSKLKFIGHIQKDEKFSVRHITRQPNNWLTTISRTVISPDNRNNTLRFIKEIISKSLDLVSDYISQKNLYYSKNIIIDLIHSEKGMRNLKYTYMDDTKFCCDMDVIIESLISKLSILRESHPELFPQEGTSGTKPIHTDGLDEELSNVSGTDDILNSKKYPEDRQKYEEKDLKGYDAPQKREFKNKK